jgi:hypothetical protein
LSGQGLSGSATTVRWSPFFAGRMGAKQRRFSGSAGNFSGRICQ